MTGMAALLMLCCIAVVQLVTVEAPSLFAWVQGWSLVCSIGLVVVYALIRSGFSQRWRDPAMTLFQILASLFGAAVAYVIAGPARDIVLPIVAVILVFGSFGLTRQQMLFVLVYGMAAFALAVAAVQWWPGAGGQTPLESLATMVMVVVVMASSTLLNMRISAAREKLRQQKLSVERERDLAMRDALTGLPNRRFMQDIMGWEGGRIQRSGRNELPLLIAQLDLDHFKTINDTHGHAAGDEVLCAFAQRVHACMRASDVLARWGGEEFVLMMTHTTREDGARVLERLRVNLAELPLVLSTGTNIALTVSIGAAQQQQEESAAEWLYRADMALYAAKTGGRNRVVWADLAFAATAEAAEHQA
ncbi:MAG: diguanylate cyclase [Proteobacteria bacterium]|nr:diguanylate cyclase [Pseudomonadota bacterium]